MATIEFLYRAHIDWDFSSSEAEAAWLEDLRKAEEAGEPEPTQVNEVDASEAVDWALERAQVGTDVVVRSSGGILCWNAYIILESTSAEDLRRVCDQVEAVIRALPFCRLIEE